MKRVSGPVPAGQVYCHQCGQIKPEAEVSRHRVDGVWTYHSPCKICSGARLAPEERARRYAERFPNGPVAKTPEYSNARIRAYRQTEHGRAMTRAYKRAYDAQKREERRHQPSTVPQEQIEQGAARELARHIRWNLQDRREKRCPGCEKVWGWDKYYVNRQTGRPQSLCIACLITRGKAYHTTHREHVREVTQAYNATHRAELTTKERARRDKLRTEDAAAYYAQRRAEKQQRRAWQRGNGGAYTAAQWLALKARYGDCCLCCGQREPDITLTVDHVVPLALGGTNNIGNLQPLCIRCNSAKGARWEDYRNSPYARKRR